MINIAYLPSFCSAFKSVRNALRFGRRSSRSSSCDEDDGHNLGDDDERIRLVPNSSTSNTSCNDSYGDDGRGPFGRGRRKKRRGNKVGFPQILKKIL